MSKSAQLSSLAGYWQDSKVLGGTGEGEMGSDPDPTISPEVEMIAGEQSQCCEPG